MFTVDYQQTDGKIKRIYRVIGEILREFVRIHLNVRVRNSFSFSLR